MPRRSRRGATSAPGASAAIRRARAASSGLPHGNVTRSPQLNARVARSAQNGSGQRLLVHVVPCASTSRDASSAMHVYTVVDRIRGSWIAERAGEQRTLSIDGMLPLRHRNATPIA